MTIYQSEFIRNGGQAGRLPNKQIVSIALNRYYR